LCGRAALAASTLGRRGLMTMNAAALSVQNGRSDRRAGPARIRHHASLLLSSIGLSLVAGPALKNSSIAIAIGALAGLFFLSHPATAADQGGKINVYVDCRCPDPVGQKFCGDFKQTVLKSTGYRLADNIKSYGIGVHFSCIDLWQGINNQLTGHMAAVSVAFTIYSDTLPGEVLEDSSVFRVGMDAVGEMTRKILSALDEIVSVNSKLFDRLRAAARKTPPGPAGH
jgi:hypothetical protein